MGLVINELSPTPKSLPTKGYNNGERMEFLVCRFRERKREIFFIKVFLLIFPFLFLTSRFFFPPHFFSILSSQKFCIQPYTNFYMIFFFFFKGGIYRESEGKERLALVYPGLMSQV